jgi:DNA-binding transcriptional ArsR family regulator
MVHVLGLSPSTVSRHMDILVAAGLVEVKREGKWRYYRTPSLVGGGLATRALAWAYAGLRPLDWASEEWKRELNMRCRRREELTTCYRG